ncbi:MAG: hypothetical protein EKK56_00805 [Flavobacteriaceae bacterium]|nr:MAG: hypothetical protein EKK56_00805 [Flavobacteriaceae bacterium]
MPDQNGYSSVLSSYPTMEELFEDQGTFVNKCVKLIASWYDYFADNNRQARDDIYFLHVDQWSNQDRASRTLGRKPVLTFNYLRPMLMQMLGEERTQQPDIITSPKEPNVKTEIVKLTKSLIESQFEINKHDIKFQECFKYMLSAGFASVFHDIEYLNPKSMKKYVKMTTMDNITTCFFDPNAKEKTKKDGRFCGMMIDLPREEYKLRYPNAVLDQSFPTFRNDPLYYNYWYSKDYVRIAQMWIKLEYMETIVRLSDGRDMTKQEALKEIKKQQEQLKRFKKLMSSGVMPYSQLPDPLEIIEEKEDICFKQFKVRMSYQEILEIQEWPSDKLPGVFADCDSIVIDGRQMTMSWFRAAQDAQRYYNYLKSESAESILNGHHLNWLGTPENVKGNLIDYWKNPQQSKTILLAEYDSKGNLPQPVPPAQISPALESQAVQTRDDIMNTIGRYEATMGKQGNEKSGAAIEKRALNSSLSSFVPFDNLKQVIQESAEIILDLLPAIYENEETVLIKAQSGERDFIKVNQTIGDLKVNDISEITKVEVKINVGASQVVQKMANFDMFLQLMQLNPQLSTVLLDLAAENLDLDNINQVVTRIKENIIPPQVLAKEEGRPLPQPSPEQMQQQKMMQAAQQAAMMAPIQEAQIKASKLKIDEQKIVQDEKRLELDKIKLMQDRQEAMMKAEIDKEKMKTELQKARLDAHVALNKGKDPFLN